MPSHTSHVLQPLDVSCFRELKLKLDAVLSKWQKQDVGIRRGKKNFAKLLGKSWLTISAQNIINGFKATGIYDETLKGTN